MNAFEERLYEIAGQELVTKKVNRGLWTRAFSQALGDEPKTKAIYIELRVEQLREQHVADAQRQREIERERSLPETDRIRRRVRRFSSVPFEDTDHIPRDGFSGDPRSLQHPVAVTRAAQLCQLLDFQIIDLIKRGYLRGVWSGEEWFFDLEGGV